MKSIVHLCIIIITAASKKKCFNMFGGEWEKYAVTDVKIFITAETVCFGI